MCELDNELLNDLDLIRRMVTLKEGIYLSTLNRLDISIRNNLITKLEDAESVFYSRNKG